MYARNRLRLARDTQITPAELEADRRARDTYEAVMHRPAIRTALNATPLKWQMQRLRKTANPGRTLTQLCEEITALVNAGATEDEVRLIEVFVGEYIGDHYVGTNTPTLPEIDRAETDAEADENRMMVQRYTQPDAYGDAEKLREAQANRREAAISITRARALERQVRDGPRQREEFLSRCTERQPLRSA